MNLEELKQSGRIIYQVLRGSRAYGIFDENSDFDMRGFFIVPKKEYLGLKNPPEQINDLKNDEIYYSLKRGFELLIKANPNMIELLWMPEDCIHINSSKMERIIADRNLFISKQAFFTHAGYAKAQISKARGSNKKVHNPQPEKMPKKEDFCYIIPGTGSIDKYGITCFNEDAIKTLSMAPCRPIPVSQFKIGLEKFHCARLEYTEHIYRLYYYGETSKGIFRGDDMLVPESIPLEDENEKFYGFLIYNKNMYDKALKDWHSYWDWKRNRNESRWIDQEKGILTYDAKNMTHCMRLLFAAEEILLTGNPLVRFEDDRLDYLWKIKRAELSYEEIMEEVEKKMKCLKDLYEKSSIPDKVDLEKIDKLYRDVTRE